MTAQAPALTFGDCFHCGAACMPRGGWRARIDDVEHVFCCAGCLAVAHTRGVAGGAGWRLAAAALVVTFGASGIYRALVAARARIALERGRRYLQVDASDDSRPILERLGFIPVGTTTPYVWTPA